MVGTWEEAIFDAGVTEGHKQEDDGRAEGMHEVDKPDPKPLEVTKGASSLIIGASVVEDVEIFEGDEAVVELPVLAHKAVGECEDDAGDKAKVDEKGRQVLVRHGANAVVSEWRWQRPEGQNRPRRQQLGRVGCDW